MILKSRPLGLATLLAFDLILFAPLLATGGVYSSHDFVRAHHPWRQTAHGVLEAENRLLSDPAASGQTTLVRYRQFPSGLFWNPWIAAGGIGPFQLAQGFLSPFVALPALLLPEAGIETGILFLKFNFAFLAAYAFLRGRKFSDLAAAAGAATWAFATGQTVWGLWMHTSVSVTYPLLLMAVDRAFDEPRTARALRFATLSILLCLLGGFPHWILFGALAAGLYLLMRAVERRARPRDIGRALGRLALASAVAVAILTPSILATARFLEASEYGNLRRGMGGSHALPLRQLRLYFLPDYLGTPRRDDYHGVGWIPGDNYIETAAGVGVAAAALAFVGLASARRRKEAFYAILLGAAVAIPLYAGGKILETVGGLPLLEIGLFARAKILILLALGILAACGAESLERLAAASPLRALALKTAPFLVAVPLAFLTLDFYPECRPQEAVFQETPGIRRLRALTADGSRFAAAGWTLIPNVSEALGLQDARGHFTLDARYRQLAADADPASYGTYGTYLVFDPLSLDPAARALDVASVRFLAAPPGVSSPVGAEVEKSDAAPFHAHPVGDRPPRVPAPAMRAVYRGDDLTIFERASALPRFRLEGPGTVRTIALEPERFEVETDAPGPVRLATSQKAFAPYWTVNVDGEDATASASEGLFLALPVPEGRHRIEGRFRVPRREVAASLVGLLALAAIIIGAVRSK